MKNLFLFTTALISLVIASCSDEAITPSKQGLTGADISSRTPNLVQLCHLNEEGGYQLLQVNANALQAHLGHGDYVPDADGDGYSSIGACTGSADDCDDSDASVYPGAEEVPDDGIDQDCDGADEVSLYCPCFSKQSLEAWLQYEWLWGWWSDVPGSCKDAPYDQLLELAVYNGGSQEFNFNFGAQAGTINGSPFASSAIFNHTTQQFDLLCGGYTTAEIAEPCAQILKNFIDDLRTSKPDWDFCVRFP